MALSPEEIKAQYPLPVYNYKVSIDGETISFSQVSGLSLSFETTTYKESSVVGGQASPVTMRMPAQSSDITLTLQKGIVLGRSLPVLFSWINSKQAHIIQKKDIRIDLCDEKGEPVIAWTVRNAFPTKLDAPTFDANANDAAIETLELRADAITIEEV